MDLLRRIAEDISYDTVNWIDGFEKLYEEQDIDFESYDFSGCDFDSPSQMWYSLMECYIDGVIENLGLENLSSFDIQMDYIDGIFVVVDISDPDNEDFIRDIEEFNRSQDIQIEIVSE